MFHTSGPERTQPLLPLPPPPPQPPPAARRGWGRGGGHSLLPFPSSPSGRLSVNHYLFFIFLYINLPFYQLICISINLSASSINSSTFLLIHSSPSLSINYSCLSIHQACALITYTMNYRHTYESKDMYNPSPSLLSHPSRSQTTPTAKLTRKLIPSLAPFTPSYPTPFAATSPSREMRPRRRHALRSHFPDRRIQYPITVPTRPVSQPTQPNSKSPQRYH